MNVIFCLPGHSFSGRFLRCWTELVCWCQRNSITPLLSQCYNSNVYYVRSQCLGANVLRGRTQAPFDGKIPYDYIMWIDSDVIFKPDDFLTLLQNKELDITAGLYPMDGGTHFAIVQDWNAEYFKKYGSFQFIEVNDYIIQQKRLFEVAYSGMGFMLVKRGVFEKIDYPWFAPEFYDMGNDVYDFCSEDVGFCRKAIKAGFKIWADPNVILKHEKTILY